MGVTVGIPELRALIVARLNQQFRVEDSQMMADAVLFGELSGRPSHGILRILPGSYGPTDEEPGPAPTIERMGRSAARIDGRPGLLVASLGTKLAKKLASQHGLAVVATRGSRSTSGSLTYYVEQLTNAGLIAFVCANTLSIVTPQGGKERILGTNPLAIGIPALGYPFIVDIATSAVTGGDVVTAASTGSLLPPGVAVDRTGDATTDPHGVLDGVVPCSPSEATRDSVFR